MIIKKVENAEEIYTVFVYLLKKGYSVTLKEAEYLWGSFSNYSYCTSCMIPSNERLDEFENWINDHHEVKIDDDL